MSDFQGQQNTAGSIPKRFATHLADAGTSWGTDLASAKVQQIWTVWYWYNLIYIYIQSYTHIDITTRYIYDSLIWYNMIFVDPNSLDNVFFAGKTWWGEIGQIRAGWWL